MTKPTLDNTYAYDLQSKCKAQASDYFTYLKDEDAKAAIDRRQAGIDRVKAWVNAGNSKPTKEEEVQPAFDAVVKLAGKITIAEAHAIAAALGILKEGAYIAISKGTFERVIE